MDLADRLAAHLNPLAPENLDSSGTLVRRAPIPPAHVRATIDVAVPERVQVFETGEAPLPVIGQGTVVVSVANARELLFALPQADNEDDDGRALYALISSGGCEFRVAPAGATSFAEASAGTLLGGVHKPVTGARYLVPGPEPDTYWLSVDKKNGIIRYGRGYVNISQALYQVTLGVLDKKDGVCKWVDEDEYKFIERLAKVQILQFGGDVDAMQGMRLLVQPLPVVNELPPRVVPSELITLEILSTGSATVPANLPAECQKLYSNVAGPNISISPELASAIQYSVDTDGLWCNRKLKEKAEGHGFKGHSDPLNTYLRITLGPDEGDSPGPPYVLEIWPAGHYSPIHDHGNSHAVIKVLHGSINASYFDGLSLTPRLLRPPVLLEKGDITWISPNHWQVHQLHNDNKKTVCCTIQCYSYGATDLRHYECFSYLGDDDGDGKPDFKADFVPNSDMQYLQFTRTVMQEYWQAQS